MLLHLLTTSTTTTPVTYQAELFQLIGTLGTAAFAGTSAIAIAIKQIFDTKRIGQIMQLQGRIESLEWKLKHTEDILIKTDKENANLKTEIEALNNQIDSIREQSNSSMNAQLLEIREKHNSLMQNYKKAVRIIKKFEENNNGSNDTSG